MIKFLSLISIILKAAKYLPFAGVVVGMYNRLKGSMSSKTTGKQSSYVSAAIIAVVLLMQITGVTIDDETQAALVQVLVWIIGGAASLPFFARLLLFKNKINPAPEVPLEEMLVLVRKEHESVWHEYGMCINDAQVEGWKWGVDFSERVIDLDTLTYTGEKRPYIDDKERAAGQDQVKDFVEAVKKARGGIEVCADNTDKEQ